jgi:hypothetical protein
LEERLLSFFPYPVSITRISLFPLRLCKMANFLGFVIGSCVLGTGFWSMLPLIVAWSLNNVWPYGLEVLRDTPAYQAFFWVCVLTITPVAILASIRIGRRMHFEATDGRPALLGYAGTGAGAALVYQRRAVVALGIAVVSALGAALLAWSIAGGNLWDFPRMAVLYACFVCALNIVAAIEFNDLRRTAKLGSSTSG